MDLYLRGRYRIRHRQHRHLWRMQGITVPYLYGGCRLFRSYSKILFNISNVQSVNTTRVRSSCTHKNIETNLRVNHHHYQHHEIFIINGLVWLHNYQLLMLFPVHCAAVCAGGWWSGGRLAVTRLPSRGTTSIWSAMTSLRWQFFFLLQDSCENVCLPLQYLHHVWKVEGHLEEKMQEQLMSDYGDHKPATRDAWNFLQVRLSCCGAKNYTDYINSSWANHTVSHSYYLISSWLT